MTERTSNGSWESILAVTGPETIHVIPSSTGRASAITKAAEALGGRSFAISLADLPEASDLVQRVGRELRFPYQVRGLDALLDLLADLSWLENTGPHVLLFEDANAMVATNSAAFELFVSILPNLSDRWQSMGVPFHVVFAVSDEPTAAIIDRVVVRANARLQRSADFPWQHHHVYDVRVRKAM